MIKKIFILVVISVFVFSANTSFSQSDEEKRIEQLQGKIVLLQKILADLLEQQKNSILQKNNSSYKNFNYVFKIGIKDFQTNNEVSQLQNMLVQDGFLVDIVDGKFGPKTANAVEKMKNSLQIYDKKYGEFNPLSLYAPEKNESKYNPKKITEFLGSDQIEFYSLPFPFPEEKIKNISCSDRGSVQYIFKNNKIIFPISFPYYSKTNKISCFLETKFSDKKFPILDIIKKEVSRKTFYITLNSTASGTYIAPKQSDINRATAEKEMLSELFKNADKNLVLSSPFQKPVYSKITSAFGTTRVFNGTRKSYHSGTDFRAYTGTPLKSINSGTIILSQNLFYCGNAVIINHGSGIFSTYCHLSESKVQRGQKVQRGDIIGLAGATGRVSAAHLHLSIKYDNNGTFQYIDFLDMLNRSQNLK